LSIKGRLQGKQAPAHAGVLLDPKPEIIELRSRKTAA
jgi:hypothetical protein